MIRFIRTEGDRLNSQEIGICIFAILQRHCSNRKMATRRHVINIPLNIHLDCKYLKILNYSVKDCKRRMQTCLAAKGKLISRVGGKNNRGKIEHELGK